VPEVTLRRGDGHQAADGRRRAEQHPKEQQSAAQKYSGKELVLAGADAVAQHAKEPHESNTSEWDEVQRKSHPAHAGSEPARSGGGVEQRINLSPGVVLEQSSILAPRDQPRRRLRRSGFTGAVSEACPAPLIAASRLRAASLK